LEEQETFVSEKVRLLLKEQCEKCGKQLFPKDILKNAVRSDTSDQTGITQYNFRCSCFEPNYPSLKVRIGDVSSFTP